MVSGNMRITLKLCMAMLVGALLAGIVFLVHESANSYEAGFRAGQDNAIEAQAALSGDAHEHGAVHGSPAYPSANIHDVGTMWAYHHRSRDHTFGNLQNATSVAYKVRNSQIVNSDICVDHNGGRRGGNTCGMPFYGKIHQECAGNLSGCGRKHIH